MDVMIGIKANFAPCSRFELAGQMHLSGSATTDMQYPPLTGGPLTQGIPRKLGCPFIGGAKPQSFQPTAQAIFQPGRCHLHGLPMNTLSTSENTTWRTAATG